jgi:F-type H+-transporting ATPase subunit b
MVNLYFAAAESAEASPLAALGVDFRSFIFQLLTFTLIFLFLKKFAFKPISEKLADRRQVIDDGVRMGLKMEKEKASLDKKIAAAMKDARHEADQIISNAKKESRELLREAEKAAQRKTEAMLTDAEARLEHEANQAKKHLEKELIGLVSEATESVVGAKLDSTKDHEIVKKALAKQKRSK